MRSLQTPTGNTVKRFRIRSLGSGNMSALRFDIDGIHRLAGRHEQAVTFRTSKADIAAKMSKGALAAFNAYAPNFAALARALELPGYQIIPDSEEKIKYMASSLRKGGEMSTNPVLRILNNVYEKVKLKLENDTIAVEAVAVSS